MRVGGGAVLSPYDAALSEADRRRQEEAKLRLDSYNFAHGSQPDHRNEALTRSEQHFMAALQNDDISNVQRVLHATNMTARRYAVKVSAGPDGLSAMWMLLIHP